jgi:GT2 family glycosyltransferase
MIPSISIFIVNYNTRELLERCLTSIFATKGDLDLEVFVADNNSTDGSPDMVESVFPDVSVTRYSQNMGFTKAINPLLPLGNGEYYLLLHPDLEILPLTFKQFLMFFKSHPQVGIVGGNLYYPDGTPNACEILFPSFKNDLLCFAVRLFRRLPCGGRLLGDYNPLEWSHKSTSKVNWVWNACMMVRKQVFASIGHFDEDFFVWYADWDLCKRATDAGWDVYYLRPAAAIHLERHSFSEEDNIAIDVRYKVEGWHSAPRMIQDRHRFLKKHTSPGSVFGVKIIDMVQNALRFWLILGNLVFRKIIFKEASFQLRACLQTIQAILKA